MKIDTSEYYPEVGGGDGYSLNRREGGLFGPGKAPESPEECRKGEEPERSGAPERKPGNMKDADDAGRLADGVAHLLSWLLVPLMMPVYGLMLAFGLSILDVAPMGMRVRFVLVVAGINVLLPMALVVLLKRLGLVADLGLNGRRERLIPYIITICCLAGTAWFMASKGAPSWLTMFFAGGAVGALMNMLINFGWKISAHAAGIAGLVALLIRIEKDGSAEPALMGWLVAVLLLAGLLGSARVWLGRHTVWQVLAGYLVGFCSVFFLTLLQF